MSEKLLSETEICNLYGGSRATWVRRRQRGDGPPFLKFGKHRQSAVRYRLSDVEKWLADKVRRSTSDSPDIK